MRAPLHVLVVLLCSAYRVCSCSLLFKAPHPIPPLWLYFLYSLITIYSVSFPLFFQFSVTGAGAGAGAGFFLAGGARGWVASRAGSWVFWLFGFGVSSSSSPSSWAPNLHMRRRPSWYMSDHYISLQYVLFLSLIFRLRWLWRDRKIFRTIAFDFLSTQRSHWLRLQGSEHLFRPQACEHATSCGSSV